VHVFVLVYLFHCVIVHVSLYLFIYLYAMHDISCSHTMEGSSIKHTQAHTFRQKKPDLIVFLAVPIILTGTDSAGIGEEVSTYK